MPFLVKDSDEDSDTSSPEPPLKDPYKKPSSLAEALRKDKPDAQRELFHDISTSTTRLERSTEPLASVTQTKRPIVNIITDPPSRISPTRQRPKSVVSSGNEIEGGACHPLKEIADAFNASLQRSKARLESANSGDPPFNPPATAEIPAPPSWNLPSTLRQDFDHHEPVMFSDASSTVPDNSLERRLMVETAQWGDRALSAVNSKLAAASGEENGSSSIPWSAYLATQSGKATSSPKPKSGESPLCYLVSSHERPGSPGAMETKTRQEPSDTPAGAPPETKFVDQCGLDRGTSGEVVQLVQPDSGSGSREKGNLMVDELAHLVEPVAGSSSHKRKRKTETAAPRTTSKSADMKSFQEQPFAVAQLSDMEAHPPLMKSIPQDFMREIRSNDQSARLKSRKVVQDDEVDELAIELPKEMYKPRPSRSRSAQVTTIDLSQFPQERRSTKRRKITAQNLTTIGTSIDSPTATKVDMIAEMGFSPTNARSPLKEVSGEVGAAIDLLISGSLSPNAPATGNLLREGQVTETRGLKTVLERVETDTPIQYHTSEVRIVHERSGSSLRQLSHIRVTPPLAQDQRTTENHGCQIDAFVTESSVGGAIGSTRISRTLKGKRTPHMSGATKEETVTENEQGSKTEANSVRGPAGNSLAEGYGDTLPASPPIKLESRVPRKRGRGRPRKDQIPLVKPSMNTDNNKDAAALEHRVAQQRTARPDERRESDQTTSKKPLQETEENPKLLTTAKPKAESGADGDIAETTGIGNASPPPVADSKLAGDAKVPSDIAISSRTTQSHSPVSNGKTSLRVGLSRRARIAPLLKVMKK